MKNIQSRLINSSSLTLFLLIVIPSGISYHSSENLVGTIMAEIVSLFGGIVFLYWLFSICKLGNESILKQHLPAKNIFYAESAGILFLFAVIASFVQTFYQAEIIHQYQKNGENIYISKPAWLPILLILSVLYIIYFAAKTIKTLELKREASFKEYLGIVFLFICLPIGVFFIQPKVRTEINASP